MVYIHERLLAISLIVSFLEAVAVVLPLLSGSVLGRWSMTFRGLSLHLPQVFKEHIE